MVASPLIVPVLLVAAVEAASFHTKEVPQSILQCSARLKSLSSSEWELYRDLRQVLFDTETSVESRLTGVKDVLKKHDYLDVDILEEEEEFTERAVEIFQAFSIVDFERSTTERAAEITELSEKKNREPTSPFFQVLLQEVTEHLLETIDHMQTRIKLVFGRESMKKFQKTIRIAALFDDISVEHDTDDPTAIAIRCFDEAAAAATNGKLLYTR